MDENKRAWERRVLTNSRMSCAKKCLRSHFFKYELGIRKDVASAPLRFGSAWHKCLDLVAKGTDITVAIAEVTDVYSEKTCPTWSTPREWAIEGYKLQSLLHGYFDYWSSNELALGYEVIASEVSFEIAIKNPETGRSSQKFILSGVIDKIIRLADTRLAIMEHKTTGDELGPESDYWPRLRIDPQISIYMKAAREYGYDVACIIYDVTRKPTIRPSEATPEDKRKYTKEGKLYANMRDVAEAPEEYAARLVQDIRERPEFYYARKEIPRMDSDIAELDHDVWQTQQIIADCQRLKRWPRNAGSCIFPFKCEYCDLCFNGINPENGLPQGFSITESLHPELKGE